MIAVLEKFRDSVREIAKRGRAKPVETVDLTDHKLLILLKCIAFTRRGS